MGKARHGRVYTCVCKAVSLEVFSAAFIIGLKKKKKSGND